MSQQAIKGSVNIRGDYAEQISKKIISDIKTYLNIDACTLGSTGKKKHMDYSGDIDIAILQEFNDTNIDKIKKYICNQYGNDTIFNVLSGFSILSFGYKYKEQNLFAEDKLVQVDLMFTDDLIYSSFMYHSPNYKNNESNFKGLFRTNLLVNCASFTPIEDNDNKYKTGYFNDDTNNIKSFWKYSLSYIDGLRIVHKSYEGKRGPLKNPVTIKEDTVFITKDPNEIIKIILGDYATLNDVNSFENLIIFLFSKHYKYTNSNILTNILNEFLNDKRHISKVKNICNYIIDNIIKKPENNNLYIDMLKESILYYSRNKQ